jgi:plastocyanin
MFDRSPVRRFGARAAREGKEHGMVGRFRRLAVGAVVVAAVMGQMLPAQASTTVAARCNFFSPKSVTITHGGKVVWKSACRSHTVTSWSSNWSKDTTLQAGGSTSRVFNSRGTYKFRCRFHSTVSGGQCSGMCGTVKVT